MRPVVAITVGDYNGIGPEVTLRALANPGVRRLCTPLLVGPRSVFSFYAARYALRMTFFDAEPGLSVAGRSGAVPVVDPGSPGRPVVRPGTLSRHAGENAAGAIETGVRLVRAGFASALVTAPVSKRGLHLGGSPFPGQTEMLQHLTGVPAVAMVLETRALRVGLATIHMPLRKVPRSLTKSLLLSRLRVMHEALQTDWRIRRPRMAVLGLNPHAGEQGDLGHEEQQIITPVIGAMWRRGAYIEGPFPADGFFGEGGPKDYDIVVAMYHDQGLIPLKFSGFREAVNVTAGLPFVRTSPGHGTAFDIAGKGIADPSSMIAAIRLGVTLSTNRQRRSRR